MSLNVYQVITDRIIKSLEQGNVPWRQPWRTSAPKNIISKKAYRGVNVFLLNANRYTSPWWMTYAQCTKLGGQVRKGERSTPVIFWELYEDRANPAKKVPVLRYFNVFCSTQCDGISVPMSEDSPLAFDPIEAAENVVAGYQGCPPIFYGGDRAAYRPEQDEIDLPYRESFGTPEEFYSTQFHELIHSTGAKKRLNRDGVINPIKYGSHDYSVEELIAECGASFLAGETGIINTTFDNSVAYIGAWISKLRHEPRWIVQAGGAAAAACDYILGRAKVQFSSSDEDEPPTYSDSL